jgi:hypothetical protein
MDDIVDLLQIKIEKAKTQLSDDTLNAINAVPWKDVIIGMREKKGYSFEQLGNLELETELVLCGLLSPENYPKELQNRMGLGKPQTAELVNEMNELVFAPIKEELIKNSERKKIFAKKATKEEDNVKLFRDHGIEIVPARNADSIAIAGGGEKETLPVPDLPAVPSAQQMQAGKLELKGAAYAQSSSEPKEVAHPIVAQKLSDSVQTPTVKTEHTLDNLTPSNMPNVATKTDKPKVDPYREIPE